MFTEIKEGKRVLTKEINLDKDIGLVLSEFNFKDHGADFFYLPNPLGVRIEVILTRGHLNYIKEISLKFIDTNEKEFLFFKNTSQVWTVFEEAGDFKVGKQGEVIRYIMDKIREFWVDKNI